MGPLRAVIFDVDATLADSERHGHRVAFNRAFAEFGLPGVVPAATVAVEDSDNGVRAARAAGLAVAVVTNDYTAGHTLAGAAVVLDGFGTPARPATVRRD